MAKLNVYDKLCLVTGATGGIGAATCRALADRGARLILTDLDQTSLNELAAELKGRGVDVPIVLAVDLTDASKVKEFAAQVHEKVGSIDLIFNVAGISIWGSIERLQEEHWRRLIDINLMGPVNVLSAFVPPMIKARRGGHIVNVSSAAGIFGLPWHAGYSASKFGLRGISEVLRFDLRKHRIGVSLVCPGAVATPLVETLEVVGVDRSAPSVKAVEKQFIRHAVTPEHAAKEILKGVERRKYWVYTSPDIRLGHLAQRWVPWGYEYVMRMMNRQLSRAIAEIEK